MNNFLFVFQGGSPIRLRSYRFMIKRILLIRPPSKDISRVLPLGLMYLGSALKEKNIDVKLLDLRLDKFKDADLNEEIKTFNPEVIGIGLLTVESKSAHQIARHIKNTNPTLTVIFGGPHCEADPGLILNDTNIDFMVIGEGEKTFSELVSALQGNGNADKVKGIAYRKNGRIIKTKTREPIMNLDNLNPDYGLVDLEDYFQFSSSHEYLPQRKRFLPMFTSRGCPFECVYCHNIFGKKIRYISEEEVFSQIEFLHKKYKIEEFHFLDDSFNIDIKRAKGIFDLIFKSGMDIRIAFPNGIRADFIDDELIDKMKKAGVYRLAIGIESASERILKMVNKSLDISNIKNLVKKLDRAGISSNGFFMLCFPTETREEMMKTVNFACSLDLTTAEFSILIPNPGTKLCDSININQRDEGPYNFENYDYTSVNLNQSCVSSEELVKIRRKAYWKFYFSPVRIWNIFKATPQKTLVLKKMFSRAGFLLR